MRSRMSKFTALILAVVALVGLTVNGQRQGKVQWEYKMLYIPETVREEESVRILNELGAQGWEAYSVNQNGLDMTSGQYHFKRMK